MHTQDILDDDASPCLFYSPPRIYTENYSSFSTAFLTPTDIQNHWDDTPILINDFNSETTLESQFLDAAGRVCVDEHFTTRISKCSVIDFGFGDSTFRYMATYTHLIDGSNAYIRLVAYDWDGHRCDSAHPDYGNFILVIPRDLNEVPFPVQLRFHALNTTACYNESHPIRKAAWSGMAKWEKKLYKYGSLAIVCDLD
jgi:hypothetical protein